MIDRKNSLESLSEYQLPLLHLAVLSQIEDNLRLLIDNVDRININEKDGDGRTALHYVAASPSDTASNVSMARILIDAGANVNAKDKDGATPLHYAIKPANVPIVKILVADSRTDINAENKKGLKPLKLVKTIMSLVGNYLPQIYDLLVADTIWYSTSESKSGSHYFSSMGGGGFHGSIPIDEREYRRTQTALIEIKEILENAGAKE